MIEVEAVLDENGVLRSCKACGHAGAGKTGADIVCAAVSVLMRTAVRVLSTREGITIRYDAPEPGFLFLEADYTADGKDFLSAAGVFLIEGIASVAGEYPDNCKLAIRRT
ncbi:MAG: ribosomal-processing cysteine protease Prp [Treponema sp.]|nr:ribosomal-processing cysteine protease Prp [Treponema sp.]